MGKIGHLPVAADKKTERGSQRPFGDVWVKTGFTTGIPSLGFSRTATLLSELLFVWSFGFLTTKVEDC